MNELRLKKIRERMAAAQAEAVILSAQADIFYLTSIKEIEGIIVVSETDSKIFVSPLYGQLADEQLPKESVVTKNLMKDVIAYLNKEGIQKVGLDYLTTTIQHKNDLSQFEIVDFTNQTKIVRMIKEKEEINSIKRAAITARNAFLKVYPYIQEGKTEKEIADELTYQLRKAGAQKESFETIVASGANAAYPHHIPTNKKFKSGEFVVIDFGAIVDGYHSDTTYTFLLGEKDKEKKELFNAVFYAQLFATEMIAPRRTKIKDIEERARKELSKYNLDKYFIHSLGHGVGIEVHEFPYINTKNDMVVEPNMVFTIEPGIYIPNRLGIRLENMILVKENDVEVIAFTPLMELM